MKPRAREDPLLGEKHFRIAFMRTTVSRLFAMIVFVFLFAAMGYPAMTAPKLAVEVDVLLPSRATPPNPNLEQHTIHKRQHKGLFPYRNYQSQCLADLESHCGLAPSSKYTHLFVSNQRVQPVHCTSHTCTSVCVCVLGMMGSACTRVLSGWAQSLNINSACACTYSAYCIITAMFTQRLPMTGHEHEGLLEEYDYTWCLYRRSRMWLDPANWEQHATGVTFAKTSPRLTALPPSPQLPQPPLPFAEAPPRLKAFLQSLPSPLLALPFSEALPRLTALLPAPPPSPLPFPFSETTQHESAESPTGRRRQSFWGAIESFFAGADGPGDNLEWIDASLHE